MLAIMGENSEKKSAEPAEPFKLFEDLVIRGYLACRDNAQDIISIVDVMIQSQLPCFKPDCIKDLKTRLSFDLPENEAVQYMKAIIEKSYESLYSVVYDLFQKYVEKVNC